MINYKAEYIIKDFYISDTKAGKKMGKMTLEDTDSKEQLNCILWQEMVESADPKTLRTGNTVRILSGEYKEQYKNTIIKELGLVSEAPTGLESEERDELFKLITDLVGSFKNTELKEALSQIIFENAELFKISPAAVSMHHNYVGGLMQHLWECVQFAQSIFPLFKKGIDLELILAGCLMHDIGKMFEYKVDLESGVIEYSEEFRKNWITHSQYGFSWAMSKGLNQLARIIAAHHGRKDWGAIIDLDDKNLENELYLVHHIDDLSAKFGVTNVSILQQQKVQPTKKGA